MKKAIILIFIAGALFGLQNYLQNFHNRAIIEKTFGVSDPVLAGYILGWDSGHIYLVDENEESHKVEINAETIYLRTYVDENEKLLQQERIVLDDFIKDQYIKIDIFRGTDDRMSRALIVRQLIYVEAE